MKEIIRAPGQGLLTISTKPKSTAQLEAYFSSKQQKYWSKELLKRLQAKPKFSIIGIPSDSGGGLCRGAAHGPLHLRLAMYKKNPAWAKNDLGDIPCIPQLVHDSMLNKAQLDACARALWGKAFKDTHKTPVSPLNILEEFLNFCFAKQAKFKPLVLGGDHSISGAVFAALARAGKTKKLAVLHFDAHTDLLESRFGIKHCYGTWTSHALRLISDPRAWVQVGVRASGHPKKHWENKFGLSQYWAREIKNSDPYKFSKKLILKWQEAGCKHLYLTHDIDGTDSAQVPATGTPEEQGLNPAWVRTVIKECTRALPLIGSDMVEVAPVLGSTIGARSTVEIARSYIEALNWSD